MSSRAKNLIRTRLMNLIPVLIGITVNVLLSYFMYRMGMPFMLDTAGTICVAALLGPFYGVLTAIITCAVSTSFFPYAFYYSFIYAFIAIFTAKIIKKYPDNKIKFSIRLVITSALLTGVLCPLVTWWLQVAGFSAIINDAVVAIGFEGGTSYLIVYILINILVNLADKAIICGLVLLVFRLIPDSITDRIRSSRWLQNPLTKEEQISAQKGSSGVRYSVRVRTMEMVVMTALVIVLSVCWVSIKQYYVNERSERINQAQGAVDLAAGLLDAETLKSISQDGEDAPEYVEAADTLKRIQESYSNVAYLYVVTLTGSVGRCVLDTPGKDGGQAPYRTGESIELEKGLTDYLTAVNAGAVPEPLETNDAWGWLITVAQPVRDSYGDTAAYAIAEVSVSDLRSYIKEFIIKTLLFVAGIIILAVFYELWITEMYSTYPISNLVYCIDSFADAGGDQAELDNNVRRIRRLDIRTGDEIERLYQAISKMTLNQAEQMRNIRRLSESTAVMQDGLIITMADLVESRDSDTGEHVQKTAAYVKIIVEALKKKGYYAEKITPKFISDVVRSAPLHDVGKINIPDGVLNQPRKLTDEEFEIMKTHTTAGKAIIEKAISTIQGGNYLKEARNMAGYHHERWDGKGYPEGLHGEVIPLSARIMAVADVFDALTSPRVYKPAFPIEKALEIINEGAGTQFDPKCVEAFMDSLPEVRVILNKYSGKAV